MPPRAKIELIALALAAGLLGAAAFGGEISGVATPAARVKSVLARDRDAKKDYPAALDAKTGEYRVKNLPAGRYDLVLETDAGRIEGVDLRRGAAELKAEPMTLKPSELDRGQIAQIAAHLAQIVDKKDANAVRFDAFVARVREGRLAGASLRAPAAGAGAKPVVREVTMADDDREAVGDALLGLTALVRAREKLPRDFDVEAGLDPDAGELRVTPVAPELTDKDRARIVDWVDKLKLFENKKRVLDMDGNGAAARVLVEKLRDDDAGPTTLAVKEPTAFWRIEIWDFNKHYGGWTKDKATVVVREQAPIRVFRAYRWMFEKRLGGIVVTADGVATVPPYDVPEKLDPARGRTPY